MPNIEKELNSEEDAKKRLMTEELARLRGEEEQRKSIIEVEGEVSSEFSVSNPSLAFMEALVKQDMEIKELGKDRLTGAALRSVFVPKMQNILLRLSQVEREGDRRQEKEEPMKVMFMVCDLDNFKAVNDRDASHSLGDNVLKRVAAVIKQNIRETDLLCRWGGDEFSVVLPGPDETKAAEIAEKIRGAVEKAMRDEYGELLTSLSIGYFVYEINSKINKDNVEEELNNAMDRADAAAYAAKEGGKNKIMSANLLSSNAIQREKL